MVIMNLRYHAYTSLRNMQLVRVINKNNTMSVGSGSSDVIIILVFHSFGTLLCSFSFWYPSQNCLWNIFIQTMYYHCHDKIYNYKLKFPSVAFSFQGGISTPIKG